MKVNINLFSITIVLLFITCTQPTGEKKAIVARADTAKTTTERKEQERLEKRRQMDEQEKYDSTELSKMLNEAISMAEKQANKNTFRDKFIATMPDSSFQVEITINSDYYFTKDAPHLIIRRTSPANVYIDIFTKTGRQFTKVTSHEQWTLEYTNDTIQDINGDGLKDLVVNWYGSTGCCLKGFSDIYLLRANKKTFSKGFKFINPTFSPKEKMIRGVCYGHPGETEMYKYRWKSESVDTLEYVYFEKNDNGEKTGKIIVSNNRPYSGNQKIIKRINHVPAEYKKIDGYGWFMDDFHSNR